MPLQQMFRCPPLTYASRLNNQRTISMPLVTQSLWEPQEAKSAQYASYSIFLLITRLDHSNPFSSVAMANHSSFRIFAMTFVYYIRLPPRRIYNTHSLQIGAATSAAAAGIPVKTIKQLGWWRSNAYRSYIRPMGNLTSTAALLAQCSTSSP